MLSLDYKSEFVSMLTRLYSEEIDKKMIADYYEYQETLLMKTCKIGEYIQLMSDHIYGDENEAAKITFYRRIFTQSDKLRPLMTSTMYRLLANEQRVTLTNKLDIFGQMMNNPELRNKKEFVNFVTTSMKEIPKFAVELLKLLNKTQEYTLITPENTLHEGIRAKLKTDTFTREVLLVIRSIDPQMPELDDAQNFKELSKQ